MARDVSITVRIVYDGEDLVFPYDNAEAAVNDEGLRHLFDDKLVTECIIERRKKRLASLPFMTWERFRRSLEWYACK